MTPVHDLRTAFPTIACHITSESRSAWASAIDRIGASFRLSPADQDHIGTAPDSPRSPYGHADQPCLYVDGNHVIRRLDGARPEFETNALNTNSDCLIVGRTAEGVALSPRAPTRHRASGEPACFASAQGSTRTDDDLPTLQPARAPAHRPFIERSLNRQSPRIALAVSSGGTRNNGHGGSRSHLPDRGDLTHRRNRPSLTMSLPPGSPAFTS